MGQKKSTSISRDLLQLYRRCVVHNLIHCPLVIFIFIFICTCMFFSSVSTCYWTSMFSSFVVFITYEVVKLCFPISILWLPFFFVLNACLVDLNSVPQPQGVNILVWSLKLVAARICAVSFDFFFVNMAGMNKLKITSQLPLFFFFFPNFFCFEQPGTHKDLTLFYVQMPPSWQKLVSSKLQCVPWLLKFGHLPWLQCCFLWQVSSRSPVSWPLPSLI